MEANYMFRDKLYVPLLILMLALVGLLAHAAFAGGPRLANTSTGHQAIACGCATCLADAGPVVSTSVTLSAGDYLLTVGGEPVNLCTFDSGCAVGGHPLPLSLVMRMSFNNNGLTGTPVSCRSATADGGIDFTRIAPGS